MNYPNLDNAKIICLDIETLDPKLEDNGPGVYRKDGKVLGVGLATNDGFKEYYNIGHYDCTETERIHNKQYLKDTLSNSVKKLGTNIIYDLDWLEVGEGIKVNGQLYDIQIAEPLLDENQGEYSLEFQSQKYLGKGKNDLGIKKFCEDNGLKGDPRKWIYKMPYSLVREYVFGDVENPIDIFQIQWREMYKQELLELFHMECDLIRCILLMRKTGVRINTELRDKNAYILQNKLEENKIKLYEKYGEFNYNSSKQLANIFDVLGIPYLTTKKGNPTIDHDYLESIEDSYEIAKQIIEIKKYDRTINGFLNGSLNTYITENNLIHCSFHSLRKDENGTRTGRFSSSNPNLQQIPSISKDIYLGTMCREVFLPFEDCWWGKIDYSQIEYRFMAHFASGEGSEEVRQAYRFNPNTDYHQYIMDLTGLSRKFAKNLNFGIAYGMGAPRMSKKFGWDLSYCYEVLNIYHNAAPFIKSTIKSVENIASKRGYIKTILGRRARLVDKKKIYVMFNRLIQGSAADQMKKAMLNIYKAGLFDILPPHLTVHDELNNSIPKTRIGIEAFREMKNLMENAIPLKVPVIADAEVGESWAKVSKEKYEELLNYNGGLFK